MEWEGASLSLSLSISLFLSPSPSLPLPRSPSLSLSRSDRCRLVAGKLLLTRLEWGGVSLPSHSYPNLRMDRPCSGYLNPNPASGRLHPNPYPPPPSKQLSETRLEWERASLLFASACNGALRVGVLTWKWNVDIEMVAGKLLSETRLEWEGASLLFAASCGHVAASLVRTPVMAPSELEC